MTDDRTVPPSDPLLLFLLVEHPYVAIVGWFAWVGFTLAVTATRRYGAAGVVLGPTPYADPGFWVDWTVVLVVLTPALVGVLFWGISQRLELTVLGLPGFLWEEARKRPRLAVPVAASLVVASLAVAATLRYGSVRPLFTATPYADPAFLGLWMVAFVGAVFDSLGLIVLFGFGFTLIIGTSTLLFGDSGP